MNYIQLLNQLDGRILFGAMLLLIASLLAYKKGQNVHSYYFAISKSGKSESRGFYANKFMEAYFPFISTYFATGIISIGCFFSQFQKLVPQTHMANIIAMIVFAGSGLLLLPMKREKMHSFAQYFAWYLFLLGIGFLLLEFKLLFVQ